MPQTSSTTTRKRPKPYDAAERPSSKARTTSGQASSSSSIIPLSGEATPIAKVSTGMSSRSQKHSRDHGARSNRVLDESKEGSKSHRARSDDQSASTSNKREGDEESGIKKRNKKKKRKNSLNTITTARTDSPNATNTSATITTIPTPLHSKDRGLNATPDPLPVEHIAKPPSGNPSLPLPKSNMIDQHMKAMNKKNAEIERLEVQLNAAKDEAAKMKKDLTDRVRALEEENQEYKLAGDGKDQKLEEHRKAKETLEEACQCGVCMDILDDPHTLSCGHIACKKCLISWFRTPGAYQSPLPHPIPEDLDLSYWRKSCHVCRAVVLSRPTRLFFLAGILGPLGIINPYIPTSSSQTNSADPWEKIFPPERNHYRIYDDSDAVYRCPSCGFEIMDGICTNCNAEFSDEDAREAEFEDFESDGRAPGDDDTDDPDGIVFAGRGMLPNPIGARFFGGGGPMIDDEAISDEEDDEDADEDENDDEDDDSDGTSEISDGSLGGREDTNRGVAALQRDNRLRRTQALLRESNHLLERARGFRRGADTDEEVDESEDEDAYEDSFINDDESEGDGTDQSTDEDYSGSEVYSDGEGGSEENDSSEVTPMQLDEPPVEEMRRRRLGRLEPAPVAVVNQHAGGSRRSGSRRARAIIVDSDEE